MIWGNKGLDFSHMDGPEPVSYTHLDVYKRQLRNWAAAGSDGTVSDICACLADKREGELWDECVRRVLENEDSPFMKLTK